MLNVYVLKIDTFYYTYLDYTSTEVREIEVLPGVHGGVEGRTFASKRWTRRYWGGKTR